MADSKISALTSLAGGSVVTADDVLPIVDTSVTTTKKITVDDLKTAMGVQAATTSVSGMVELLNQSEYDAGTDTSRVPTASLNKVSLLATQATTSGTTKDFTIPAGVREISVLFVGVSTNSTSNLLIQIGDSGGIENSGYDSSANATGAAVDATSTAGFVITQLLSASDAVSGSITLRLVDSATFTWVSSGAVKQGAGSGSSSFSAGSKSLSAELTTVRVTSVSGDTFDAGLVGCSYIK